MTVPLGWFMLALVATEQPSSPVKPTPPAAVPAARVSATIDGVELRVAVVPATSTVGDVVRYSIEIVTPVGVAVARPRAREGWGAFELRSPFAAGDERREGEAVVHQFFADLTVFETGILALPQLDVVVRDLTTERELTVPQVSLTVRSVLPAGEPLPPIHDLKALRRVLRMLRGMLLALSSVLLVTLHAIYLWWHRIRRVRVADDAPQPLHSSYQERALYELNQLCASASASDRDKWFYVRLAEIVRSFLGSHLGFDASDLTSDELQRSLRSLDLGRDVIARVAGLTDTCDLAKFARHRPGDEEHEQAVAVAFWLIEQAGGEAEGRAA